MNIRDKLFGAAGLMLLVQFFVQADTLRAQHGASSSNPARYESEGRDAWQMPDSVVCALGLREGAVVADIGAASGYFSRRFSPAVGKGGRVLAVDVDSEALGYLAGHALLDRLANLDTVQAEPDNPHLPAGGVDLIFMCNTLHHLPSLVNYLASLKASLRPGGRIAVVDFYKRELPVGPRELAHKLSEEEAREAFGAAGYKITKKFTFLPYQYFFIAEPTLDK